MEPGGGSVEESEHSEVQGVNEDYLSFEKVLKELQIEEEELKRLVSAGEIKAFRDADTMKFKREEIERLKKGKESDPDVIEILDEEEDEGEGAPTLDSSSGEIAEELSFDEDEEIGMTTAEISDEDFLTEELGGEEEGGEEALGELEIEEEELLGEAEEVPSSSREQRLVKRSKVSARLAAEEDQAAEPQWALGIMILSAIVLVLGVLVAMDIATSTPSPVVEWLVGMF